MRAVEGLVRRERGGTTAGRVDVVPDHVDEPVAGIEALRRPRAPGVQARDRVPDHRQPRRRVHGQLATDRTQAKPPQLRVHVPAVQDQIRAPERVSVGPRAVRGPSRGAIRARGRVETLRVVHLRQDAHVDRAAESCDRLVESDQIGVASPGCDLRRRDRLRARAAVVGADVEHRSRLQPGQEPSERRAPGAALAPAEEELANLRLLPRLPLEALGRPRDSEQRRVAHAATGERARCRGQREQEREERERRPHRLSIGRKSDRVQNV